MKIKKVKKIFLHSIKKTGCWRNLINAEALIPGYLLPDFLA